MSYFVSIIFFFKHKTAYEMRISDWSSDVCSSDLFAPINVKLVAEDMVISNPEWATQDQFFTADRIEARIATFSLLTSNNRINWLHLINGTVNLEWEKGGKRNSWTFGDHKLTAQLPTLPIARDRKRRA